MTFCPISKRREFPNSPCVGQPVVQVAVESTKINPRRWGTEWAPYVKDNATGLLRELDSHGDQELSLNDDITQDLSTKRFGFGKGIPLKFSVFIRRLLGTGDILGWKEG